MNRLAIPALLASMLAFPLAAQDVQRSAVTLQAEAAIAQPGTARSLSTEAQIGTLYFGNDLREQLSRDMDKTLELSLQLNLDGEVASEADNGLLYVSAN